MLFLGVISCRCVQEFCEVLFRDTLLPFILYMAFKDLHNKIGWRFFPLFISCLTRPLLGRASTASRSHVRLIVSIELSCETIRFQNEPKQITLLAILKRY